MASNQNWDRKHPQLTIEIDGSEDVAVGNARPFKGSFDTSIQDNGVVSLSDIIIEGV